MLLGKDIYGKFENERSESALRNNNGSVPLRQELEEIQELLHRNGGVEDGFSAERKHMRFRYVDFWRDFVDEGSSSKNSTVGGTTNAMNPVRTEGQNLESKVILSRSVRALDLQGLEQTLLAHHIDAYWGLQNSNW